MILASMFRIPLLADPETKFRRDLMIYLQKLTFSSIHFLKLVEKLVFDLLFIFIRILFSCTPETSTFHISVDITRWQ